MCKAGEWTEAAGDATTDAKCSACSPGRFRDKQATDSNAEREADVCIVHTICKAGEWTKATGTAVTDTTCTPCKAGTFREKAPTNTAAEQEAHVCKPHSICAAGERTEAVGTSTKDTECSTRVEWKDPDPGVQCDTSAGEMVLKKSSKKVPTIGKCKQSCEDAAGCQSITFFKNGWCSHFSTPCSNTKKNKKTIVALQSREGSGATIQYHSTVTH